MHGVSGNSTVQAEANIVQPGMKKKAKELTLA
jgi:hypothetical protein